MREFVLLLFFHLLKHFQEFFLKMHQFFNTKMEINNFAWGKYFASLSAEKKVYSFDKTIRNIRFMVKPQTSDIRMTYEYVRVTYEYIQMRYGWHTIIYEWHTDDIRVNTSDISMTYEYIRVTYGWNTSDIRMSYEWHTGDIRVTYEYIWMKYIWHVKWY